MAILQVADGANPPLHFFETGSHHAAQASPELVILLPQPPKCWNYMLYAGVTVWGVLATKGPISKLYLMQVCGEEGMFGIQSFYSILKEKSKDI
jgi:hypothetical protein